MTVRIGLPVLTVNEAANRIGSYVCSTQGGTPKVSRKLLESVFLNKSTK